MTGMTHTVEVGLIGDSAFDRGTALTGAGPGAYGCGLDGTWGFAGIVNGGYLMAIAARAALTNDAEAGSGHDDPLVVSAAFLRAAQSGDAGVTVEVLRRGKTVTHSRVRLQQESDVFLDVQVTTGNLGAEQSTLSDSPPPPMPPPEDCMRGRGEGEMARVSAGLTSVLDFAMDPATAGWTQGRFADELVMRSWVRFSDGRPPDSLALVALPDVCPPVVFATGRFGWVPTLQMQVAVRARPEPGWCLVEGRTHVLGEQFVDEECRLWDSTGRLVAQSRQIAVTPRQPR